MEAAEGPDLSWAFSTIVELAELSDTKSETTLERILLNFILQTTTDQPYSIPPPPYMHDVRKG
jgi:hypothetical protein